MTSRSAGLLALAAALLCAPAHAQVGEKLSAVQASPLLEGRVPGASGRLTLSGGTTADLRQRGGYLTGVTLRVPVAQPARAAALAGLFTGYGDEFTDWFQAVLADPQVKARLASGVTLGAAPFELQVRTSGTILSVMVSRPARPAGAFAATAHALPPHKATTKPVVVRIYSDFQCPYCQQLEREMMPALLARLPEDVRVEFHQFPLESIHPLARPAAEASECAAQQGKFWPYKDALFRDDTWKTANPNAAFIALAGKVGLNTATFESCLSARGGKANVDAGVKEAQTLGLSATPTVFVDGHPAANPFDVAGLLRLIDYARATR